MQFDGAVGAPRHERATLFGLHIFHHREAALQCGHGAGDRVGDLRQPANRRDQHQHGGDKGHKISDGHAVAAAGAALPERHADHSRQRRRGDHLRQRRHRRRRHGGLERQTPQAPAQGFEPGGLGLLGAVQAHHAVGQHVFFDNVGQFVGGVLAGLGQLVQAPGQRLHDPGHTGAHQRDDEGELPVQVHQVPQQGDHGEPILGHAHQGRHQQVGAGLNLVDQRVRQGAGRLARKQAHFGIQQPREHGTTQHHHAVVRDPGQRVLAHKIGHAAQAEQAHEADGNHPQRHGAIAEALVEQVFQQRWNHRFGCRRHQRGQQGDAPDVALVAKERREADDPLHQGALRGRVVGRTRSHGWGGFYGCGARRPLACRCEHSLSRGPSGSVYHGGLAPALHRPKPR